MLSTVCYAEKLKPRATKNSQKFQKARNGSRRRPICCNIIISRIVEIRVPPSPAWSGDLSWGWMDLGHSGLVMGKYGMNSGHAGFIFLDSLDLKRNRNIFKISRWQRICVVGNSPHHEVRIARKQCSTSNGFGWHNRALFLISQRKQTGLFKLVSLITNEEERKRKPEL